jgi:hypothetical protein
VVAVITDSWRSPEKVTLSVLGSLWDVRTVKPRVGTAETRHTPVLPNRTDARPPADWMVCTPEPPSPQSVNSVPVPVAPPSAGLPVFDGVGVAGLVVLLAADGLTEGLVGLGALLVADGLGSDRRPALRACSDGEEKMVGAERATGGVGLVEPTTKCTVRITAVTLTAVQDSHMSR